MLRRDIKDLYDRARWYQFCLPLRTYMAYISSPGHVFFISNGVTCSLDYYFFKLPCQMWSSSLWCPHCTLDPTQSLHCLLCLLTHCYISASLTMWWMLSETETMSYIFIVVIWIWWAFKNVWWINEWRKKQMSSPLQVKYLLTPIKTQFCLGLRLDNRMIQKNIGNYRQVH